MSRVSCGDCLLILKVFNHQNCNYEGNYCHIYTWFVNIKSLFGSHNLTVISKIMWRRARQWTKNLTGIFNIILQNSFLCLQSAMITFMFRDEAKFNHSIYKTSCRFIIMFQFWYHRSQSKYLNVCSVNTVAYEARYVFVMFGRSCYNHYVMVLFITDDSVPIYNPPLNEKKKNVKFPFVLASNGRKIQLINPRLNFCVR